MQRIRHVLISLRGRSEIVVRGLVGVGSLLGPVRGPERARARAARLQVAVVVGGEEEGEGVVGEEGEEEEGAVEGVGGADGWASMGVEERIPFWGYGMVYEMPESGLLVIAISALGWECRIFML